MAIDYTGTFSITAIPVGAAKGKLDLLRVLDTQTGMVYNIYPEGQAAQCTVGATVSIYFRLINDGTAEGTCYVKFTRVGGGEAYFSRLLAVGAYVDDGFTLVMPNATVNYNIEVGHLT